MKVLITVRNVAERVCERGLPLQACLSVCVSSSMSLNATEIFRVTPGVRCLLSQSVNSSSGKLVLMLVMHSAIKL